MKGKNWIGLLGYAVAALLLTLFQGGAPAIAGMVIFVATVVFHLVANRCPHCGKFQGFVTFNSQCRSCGKDL